MNKQLNVDKLRKQYPVGTRVEVVEMFDEARPVPLGTRGTVRHVDDIGTIHVDWDNGRRLGLLPNVDKFNVVQ